MVTSFALCLHFLCVTQCEHHCNILAHSLADSVYNVYANMSIVSNSKLEEVV